MDRGGRNPVYTLQEDRDVMKSWKIHFGWAILTVLAVCVSVRVAATRQEPLSPKHVPTAPQTVASLPSIPEATATLLPDAAAAEPQRPVGPSAGGSAAQRIRALFQERNYWQDLTEALAAVKDPAEKLQLLKEMLQNHRGNTRYVAINILSQMKGRDAAELLEGALAEVPAEQTFLKPQIVDALGNVGDPGSVQVLYECLRNASDELKLSCAAALLKLGQTAPAGDLMTTLVRLYESPDGSLRKKAIESIAKLQPEGSLPILTRALRDSNGDVRLEALYAVSSMERPELLPLIETLVNDPNPEVAKEAKDYVESQKADKK